MTSSQPTGSDETGSTLLYYFSLEKSSSTKLTVYLPQNFAI